MYIVTEEEDTISLVNTRMLSGVAEQAVCDPDNIVTVRTEDSWLIVRQHGFCLAYEASPRGFFVSCILHICCSSRELIIPVRTISNVLPFIKINVAVLRGRFLGVIVSLPRVTQARLPESSGLIQFSLIALNCHTGNLTIPS